MGLSMLLPVIMRNFGVCISNSPYKGEDEIDTNFGVTDEGCYKYFRWKKTWKYWRC